MPVPMWLAFIRNMFRYIFDADYKFGGLPQVELKPLEGPLELFGARFEPVAVIHGETEIYGFRFGSAAYLTDHSSVPEAAFDKLHDLDILFLDALRHKPHPTHSTVENSLRIVERVKPTARILHPYLPRSAACGDQCFASAACTAFL